MLSLLIVSLVAGMCYGQNGKMSDCATLSAIAMGCAEEHLVYLKNLDNDKYKMMLSVGDLDRPDFVVPMLDSICNDTMHLKEYYMCAYSNVTTCLEKVNSTQIKGVPNPKAAAMGIGEMCASNADLNKTCIMSKVNDVMKCFTPGGSPQKPVEPCTIFTQLVTCSEKMTVCDGGEAVKDYIIDLRPRACPYSSSAQQYLSSAVLLLLGVSLVAFFQ